jgi:hypothetical protein
VIAAVTAEGLMLAAASGGLQGSASSRICYRCGVITAITSAPKAVTAATIAHRCRHTLRELCDDTLATGA